MQPGRDALIVARHDHSKGYDVFNALDLMENLTFLKDLKYGIGDGSLQYYLYNWRMPCGNASLQTNEVGLILL
jgi:glycylpeptide N-tetradecanoyltransferase